MTISEKVDDQYNGETRGQKSRYFTPTVTGKVS